MIDPDFLLKAKIIRAFERQYRSNTIHEIERGVCQAVPGDINFFTVVAGPSNCSCCPKCTKDCIALQKGSIVCFVDEKHYHEIDAVIAEIHKLNEVRDATTL